MDEKIKVIKRTGEIENFDQNKILKVVIAAGLKKDEGLQITGKIYEFLKENSESEITSLQIRDMVLKELREVNTDVANLYAWYESTKQ